MSEVIPLFKVLRQMEDFEPFSIAYWTFDKKRKGNTRLITIDKCIKTGRPQLPPSQRPKANPDKVYKRSKINHSKLQTRNLIVLPSREIRMCHIRLIVRFNGKKVIY